MLYELPENTKSEQSLILCDCVTDVKQIRHVTKLSMIGHWIEYLWPAKAGSLKDREQSLQGLLECSYAAPTGPGFATLLLQST